MKTVTVLGAGAWGTAIATLLAANGCQVKLWCYDKEVANEISIYKTNKRYLPGISLNSRVESYTDLAQAVAASDYIFEAVPVVYLRTVLEDAQPYCKTDQTWVILSKGIEQHTLKLPAEILDDVFKHSVLKAIVSGPSFALDLAQHQVTAVAIAAERCDIAQHVQLLLSNGYFRPYVSLDPIGVQVGGALKNVITIAMGMLEGAGYTDNAKAFLLTRGLHEIAQIAHSLGGKQETLYGLSGMGDLILSSTGSLSKNLAIGKKLGSGSTLDQLKTEMATLPEGINTVQSVSQLMKERSLDLPICKGIYEMIFHDKTTRQFLAELMNRPLESDCNVLS